MTDSNARIINLFLNIVDICIGGLFCVAGVLRFFCFCSVETVVVGFFILFFGVMVIVLEIVAIKLMVQYIMFYFMWAGRGLFYIFIGALCLQRDGYGLVLGIIAIAFGTIYCFLQCFPVIAFPEPMIGRNRSPAPARSQTAPKV